jgi:membrane-bound acyltransferase YfiQ involved in biofilm formation
MPIFLPDPVAQTLLFELLLGAVIIFSLRLKKNSNLSPGVSSELKGVAILAVIFGHVGYYLSSDTRFLYPLSIMAGVGVNLFLFLSGYGLTLSNEEKPLSSIQFYRKRLGRLFIPLWITLGAILLADAYFLNLHYPINEIIKAAFGFFPHANLYTDINSPLWYFTFIGDTIALASTGARAIQKSDNPYLYRMVENIAITAGLPIPKIHVINSPPPFSPYSAYCQ